MNSVRLLGRVAYPPRYHCTAQARDLTRLTLATLTEGSESVYHECVAWGEPAFSLYDHLSGGELVAIEGRLRYRSSTSRKRGYVVIRRWTILKQGKRALLSVADRSAGTDSIHQADQQTDHHAQ